MICTAPVRSTGVVFQLDSRSWTLSCISLLLPSTPAALGEPAHPTHCVAVLFCHSQNGSRTPGTAQKAKIPPQGQEGGVVTDAQQCFFYAFKD